MVWSIRSCLSYHETRAEPFSISISLCFRPMKEQCDWWRRKLREVAWSCTRHVDNLLCLWWNNARDKIEIPRKLKSVVILLCTFLVKLLNCITSNVFACFHPTMECFCNIVASFHVVTGSKLATATHSLWYCHIKATVAKIHCMIWDMIWKTCSHLRPPAPRWTLCQPRSRSRALSK